MQICSLVLKVVQDDDDKMSEIGQWKRVSSQKKLLLSRDRFCQVMAQFGPIMDYDNSYILFDHLLSQRLKTMRLLNPHLEIMMQGQALAPGQT